MLHPGLATSKRFIKWYITRQCDLGCVFCHNSDQRAGWDGDIDADKMVKIAEKLASSDAIAGLTLLGGEPTIAAGFLRVATALEGAPFKFGVVTAGHHLAKPQFAQFIRNRNLKFIGMSVDSLSRQDVLELRQVDVLPRQLAAVNQAVELRHRFGLEFEIYVNTVLTTRNGDRMPEILEQFRSLGVNQVKILTFNGRGRGLKSKDQLRPNMMQELSYVSMLAAQFERCQAMWINSNFRVEYCFLSSMGKDYVRKVLRVDGFPIDGHLCPISRSVAYIINDGDVYPCEDFKPYFGKNESNNRFNPMNLLEYTVEECLDSQYVHDTFKMVSNPSLYASYVPCNECRHLLKTCVPCGALGADSSPVQHDRCTVYKELLESSGTYEARQADLLPLSAPLVKHKKSAS